MIHLTVNDAPVALEVPPLRRLLDVLREDLRLTGTKEGCGEGECGACTVLVDGAAVNSCLIPICQLEGATVRTIESAGLERIQQSFLDEGGSQCGICTPGMILATRAYLDERVAHGRPVDADSAREALAGNLCRCTGYGKIIAAVLAAAGAEA
ncbi:MAG: (2Fe-2S)-binding protein [Planctomycetes bacterium]|nr:(2Fe-2S)-binding protein [Planctomycetota bacterium]